MEPTSLGQPTISPIGFSKLKLYTSHHHIGSVQTNYRKAYLVGGLNPSEKYESQLERIIPYIMENKTCLNHQPD